MEYRWMGDTGVQVSMLALGTMGMGSDDATDQAVFSAARDAGINVVDCADVYGRGAAESALGRLMSTCRDELLVMTKGYFPMGGGPNERGGSRFHLVRAVEASLERLGTDRIDIYYLHRFDDNAALERSLAALETLVQQGKILYVGFSNFAAWQAQQALGIASTQRWRPAVAMQPMYNLAKRQAESEILPMAASNKLAVFPYSPLGGGLLTGKYGETMRPDSGRIVDNPMYTTRYGHPSNFAVAQQFTALAADVGVHPVSLAVAWVASHPAVTAPLLGARNTEQLAPALAAADVEITPELRDRISSISAAPAPATDRNEEGSASDYDNRLTKK